MTTHIPQKQHNGAQKKKLEFASENMSYSDRISLSQPPYLILSYNLNQYGTGLQESPSGRARNENQRMRNDTYFQFYAIVRTNEFPYPRGRSDEGHTLPLPQGLHWSKNTW